MLRSSKLKRALGRSERVMYYLLYSALFAVMVTSIIYWFYINGKSFVWKTDGLYQHFNSFVYYGEYIRGILTDLVETGKLSIPMWDFNIGYGSDILTTLHYYVIGDPLNLLSALCPKKNAETLYCILIIVRLFLAGVSFSAYCIKMRRQRFATMVGALTYVFCGYALMAAVRHPYFINPMIYFPLVAIGIEKIFAGKRPYVFIASIFVSGVSNFYFCYMISAIAFIYAAVRYFAIFKDRTISKAVSWVMKFILYFGAGLLMSCAIFVPVVYQMLGGGRLSSGGGLNLIYDIPYYLKLIGGYIIPYSVGSWTILGYVGCIAVGLVGMFLSKRRHTALKAAFIILTALLIFPVGGYVLNGFSYVSNRWEWAYSFLVAIIMTVMIPELWKFAGKKLKVLTAVMLIYVAVIYVTGKVYLDVNTSEMTSCIALVLFVVFFILKGILKNREINEKLWQGIFMTILFVNVFINVRLVYFVGGYTEEFHQSGEALSILNENSTRAVADIDDSSFFRYEEEYKYDETINYNTAMQTGLNSISYYFSVANGNISKFLSETNTVIAKSFCYAGLDGRSMLGALADIKYFIVRNGFEGLLPYGYSTIAGTYTDSDGITYSAYENENTLPLGFTYSDTITEESYSKLSPLQKQQAMVQAAVIEDGENSSENLDFTDKTVDYQLDIGEGVEIEDGTITVAEENSEITLKYTGSGNCENYISFRNLYFNNGTDYSAMIEIKTDNNNKSFKVRTPDNQWYENTHDFLVMAGYSSEPINEITVVFGEKGVYTYDSLDVKLQPMDGFSDKISVLKEEVLENVAIGNNSVSGTINVSDDKVLCLSIPYSEGWSATVDGEDAELLRTNTMYMGLKLADGKHVIELKYNTPGLRTGIILSVVGLVITIGIAFYRRRRNLSLDNRGHYAG